MTSQKCLNVLSFLMWMACFSASAQSPTATVLGRIKDSSDAAVPNASVSVVQKETNATRTTSTDGEGSYIVSGLPIGSYAIKVERTGFKTAEVDHIVLTTGQVRRVDISLELGSVSLEIRVTAEGNALNTDDSTVGTLVDSRRVLEIPLDGRDFKQLAYLTPGVVRGVTSVAARSISVNGQRDLQNQFSLDGSPMTTLEEGVAAFSPSIEAIEEFSIRSASYPASEGWQSGGQVSITLKAGGNQFHGSLFEFNRNDATSARNFFATTTPFLNRNQFGTVFSGPLRRNRLFFLFDYEAVRQRQTSTGSLTVPDATLRTGDLSSLSVQLVDPFSKAPFPGNRIPAGRLAPQAQKVLALIPLPNIAGAASSNYRVNSPNISDDDQYFGRLDYQVSSTDRLFGRVAHQFAYGNSGSPNPNFTGQNTPTTTSILLAEQHIFSPTTLNDLRASFLRMPTLRTNGRSYTGWNTASELGITGVVVTDPLFVGVPSIAISGYSGIGETITPLLQIQEVIQIRDDLTMHRGRHSLSMGFDFRKSRSDVSLGVYERGNISFDGRWTGASFADFLLGYPSITNRGTNPAMIRLRCNNFGSYFQDDWKVTPGLTLNLGLRHELRTVPYDHSGGIVHFNPATGELFGAYTRDKLWAGDHNNFAPRFGFAWRPFSSRSDVVIRGGYGIYYNYSPLIAHRDLGLNPPFYAIQAFNTDRTQPPVLTLANPFPGEISGSSALGKSIFIIDPNQRTAYAQNWTLNVQKSLPWNLVAEGSYIGSHSIGLDTGYNYNFPLAPGPAPIATRVPYPQYGVIYLYNTPVGVAKYHALQLALRRSWSSGLAIQANYTWAKALGNAYVSGFAGTNGNEGGYQNPRDLRNEYARTGLDIRHRLVASYIYELPFTRLAGSQSALVGRLAGGWQLSGTFQAQTGGPYGVCIDGDIPNVGTIAGNGGCIRPDRIASGELANPGIDRWFNIDAFRRQADYTFGNAGRDILTGPGILSMNLGLAKAIYITEQQRVQLRAEFFNATNHTNFGNPGAGYSLTGAPFSGTGRITSAGAARVIQFGLKYLF